MALKKPSRGAAFFFKPRTASICTRARQQRTQHSVEFYDALESLQKATRVTAREAPSRVSRDASEPRDVEPSVARHRRRRRRGAQPLPRTEGREREEDGRRRRENVASPGVRRLVARLAAPPARPTRRARRRAVSRHDRDRAEGGREGCRRGRLARHVPQGRASGAVPRRAPRRRGGARRGRLPQPCHLHAGPRGRAPRPRGSGRKGREGSHARALDAELSPARAGNARDQGACFPGAGRLRSRAGGGGGGGARRRAVGYARRRRPRGRPRGFLRCLIIGRVIRRRIRSDEPRLVPWPLRPRAFGRRGGDARSFAAASRSFARALARESRKSAAAARDARSVAAVAAAIAEAATRGVDICAREVAALAREGGVATERELSEETRDTRDTRGFARRESDATNGEEEEETNDANDALDANALDAKETLNRLVPTGPFKRAVLSAYIPKRRDRRHTRKTTPPKVEKPKNAAAAPRAAAGAVRGLVRGFRLRWYAEKKQPLISGERGETTRVHAGTRARVRYAQHVVFRRELSFRHHPKNDSTVVHAVPLRRFS